MVASNTNERTRLEVLDSEMTELSLLLPAWQAEALEQAALADGVTIAQYLRRILHRNLAQINLPQQGYYLG